MDRSMNQIDPRAFARTPARDWAPLPLPPGYFGMPHLTARDVHDLDSHMVSLLDNALDRARKERIYGGVDDSWRDIGSTHGFKRFTKLEGYRQFYRVQGVIRAPMTNIMSLLYADGDADLVVRRQTVCGNALDGQTLHVLRRRTASDPHQHLAIRWEAMDFSTSVESFKLDMCGLELTGITLDDESQPTGFKIFHSEDFPECPELYTSHGLRRLNAFQSLLVRGVHGSAGHSEIVIEGWLELDELVPTIAIGGFLTNLTSNLSKLPMVIQTRRLATMKILDKSMWVPANERKQCGVCLGKFGMLSKKHHCRSCGEVVCKSCIVFRDGGDNIKFCKKCVVVACSEDDLILPDNRASMALDGAPYPRDSFTEIMHRLSESDNMSSASVAFYLPLNATNPPKLQPETGKYAEEYKPFDNSVTTASLSSYSSSVGSIAYMDSVTPLTPLDTEVALCQEDIIVLDTKTMTRANDEGSNSIRGTPRTPPSMQVVEDSIAHQRSILKEMLAQASRSYRGPAYASA
ncbi:hypothetical protein ATCC90586_002943 [Pythium insidiosum]|nr:hypothetical protein ATCC90586_002943 [Pythium insidiosum]